MIQFGPFSGASYRFFLAVILFSLTLALGKRPWRLPKSVYPIVLFSSSLMYTMDYGLIYWAEQTLSAGLAATLFATYPLFTALFSQLVYRMEPFHGRTPLGLSVAIFGIGWIHQDSFSQQSSLLAQWLPSLAVLLAAMCAGWSTVLYKRHLSSFSTITINFHQMLLGSFSLFLIALFTQEPLTGTTKGPWVGLGAIIYLAIVPTFLAFIFYYRLLQKWSAVSATLLTYFLPGVAILLEFLLLGTPIHPEVGVGMVLILVGLGITQWHLVGPRTATVT
jgi:drug/metabolite transporter (DMT)-like permease